MAKLATSNSYGAFKAGVYQHYKGPLYLVLGLSHDANEEGRVCVIYIGLQLDEAHTGPRLANRTYEDFYSWVDPATGDTRKRSASIAQRAEQTLVPRFRYLGPSYEGTPTA